jgi:hypothetical protein
MELYPNSILVLWAELRLKLGINEKLVLRMRERFCVSKFCVVEFIVIFETSLRPEPTITSCQ